jgi:hypothetical protein
MRGVFIMSDNIEKAGFGVAAATSAVIGFSAGGPVGSLVGFAGFTGSFLLAKRFERVVNGFSGDLNQN